MYIYWLTFMYYFISEGAYFFFLFLIEQGASVGILTKVYDWRIVENGTQTWPSSSERSAACLFRDLGCYIG